MLVKPRLSRALPIRLLAPPGHRDDPDRMDPRAFRNPPGRLVAIEFGHTDIVHASMSPSFERHNTGSGKRAPVTQSVLTAMFVNAPRVKRLHGSRNCRAG
jgi:hypothetical protein